MAAAAVASSSTPRPLRRALGGADAHATARHHFGSVRLRARRPHLLAVSASSAETEAEAASGSERFYFNFTGFPFPLGPFLHRRTIRTEAVKGSIWLFEQEQALGFSSVSTNTGMTVIKLRSGGLWVHAPIAPTKECIQLLKELDAPVEHIVLPTFAYEHKIFVGPFSRKFPKAQIWVAPRQWSWPINLPLEFFGIFRAKPLQDEDDATPWAIEIEQKVLSSPEVGIGPYVEVAFYHKPSKTLLVTDAVIFVPRQPPECISKESLLASAKNGLAVKILSKGKDVPDEPVVDNKLNRQKGWERMALQILFLGPSNLLEPNASFAQMLQKLIVSPIVKTLVFSKVPEKVRDWVDRITADWKFRRIIPCHFAAPINASRSDFLAAFAFLDEFLPDRPAPAPGLSLLFASFMGKAASYFPPDDMKTLSSLDEFLVSVGAVKKTVSGRKSHRKNQGALITARGRCAHRSDDADGRRRPPRRSNAHDLISSVCRHRVEKKKSDEAEPKRWRVCALVFVSSSETARQAAAAVARKRGPHRMGEAKQQILRTSPREREKSRKHFQFSGEQWKPRRLTTKGPTPARNRATASQEVKNREDGEELLAYTRHTPIYPVPVCPLLFVTQAPAPIGPPL